MSVKDFLLTVVEVSRRRRTNKSRRARPGSVCDTVKASPVGKTEGKGWGLSTQVFNSETVGSPSTVTSVRGPSVVCRDPLPPFESEDSWESPVPRVLRGPVLPQPRDTHSQKRWRTGDDVPVVHGPPFIKGDYKSKPL